MIARTVKTMRFPFHCKTKHKMKNTKIQKYKNTKIQKITLMQ